MARVELQQEVNSAHFSLPNLYGLGDMVVSGRQGSKLVTLFSSCWFISITSFFSQRLPLRPSAAINSYSRI